MSIFTKDERQYLLRLIGEDADKYAMDSSGYSEVIRKLGHSVMEKLYEDRDGDHQHDGVDDTSPYCREADFVRPANSNGQSRNAGGSAGDAVDGNVQGQRPGSEPPSGAGA